MQKSVQCKIYAVYQIEIGVHLNFMLFRSLRLLVPLTSSQDEAKTPSYRYVTGYGIARILAYSYSGSDASLLYNHVISPLVQWLVNHVRSPRLASNAITIGALWLMVSSYLIMLW